jgi:hypothetical protein
MNIPRIKSAVAVDDRTLLVQFDNDSQRKYDITPLLGKETFAPLSSPALFRSVQVELGGYAVVWNSDIAISEHELWVHGEAVS